MNTKKVNEEIIMLEDEVAEIIILALIEHRVAPDKTFTADAGTEYGLVEAWELPSGDYVVQYGDNAQTNYGIAHDTNDLAEWLLLQCENLDLEDLIVSVANIRGLDAIDEAKPNNAEGYGVLVSRNYYGPRTEHHLASGDHGHALRYETLDDAKEAADKMDEGTYFTAHNESGRPTYTVVTL